MIAWRSPARQKQRLRVSRDRLRTEAPTLAMSYYGVLAGEFDPHRLRRLADDMLRWVNTDPGNQVRITHAGVQVFLFTRELTYRDLP